MLFYPSLTVRTCSSSVLRYITLELNLPTYSLAEKHQRNLISVNLIMSSMTHMFNKNIKQWANQEDPLARTGSDVSVVKLFSRKLVTHSIIKRSFFLPHYWMTERLHTRNRNWRWQGKQKRSLLVLTTMWTFRKHKGWPVQPTDGHDKLADLNTGSDTETSKTKSDPLRTN